MPYAFFDTLLRYDATELPHNLFDYFVRLKRGEKREHANTSFSRRRILSLLLSVMAERNEEQII